MHGRTIDQRTFLKRSGVTAGAAAFAAQLPYGAISEAQAASAAAPEATGEQVRRTVCTHCSVGCSIDAVVTDGVWVRQEPVFDSPINLGAHCAKGASIREHGMTEHSHRLKYPMKLVDGKYRRISWDVAINEIGDKLSKIREESGLTLPTSSARQARQRAGPTAAQEFVALGTNNCDHGICHSTTVAGVANT
jgi:formate dehydrogenase major subunit